MSTSTPDDTDPAVDAFRLAVIIGAAPDGPEGSAFGDWFLRRVEDHDLPHPHLIDLAETHFPLALHTTAPTP